MLNRSALRPSIVILLAILGEPMSNYRSVVEAYSSGLNVDGACTGMSPFHGATAQTSPPAYSISFDPDAYTSSMPVSVTIKACTPVPFRGFLAQARRATIGSGQTEMLGSFTAGTDTQQTCSGGGLIHTSNQDKMNETFVWNPPATAEGHVQFWVTFVETRITFWAAVKSEVLRDSSIASAPDPSTLTPATVVATECIDNTSSTDPSDESPTVDTVTTDNPTSQSGTLTVPAGCGSTLGCVSQCAGASCDTVVTWRENENTVLYTISSAVPSPTSSYVSIGFSSDDKMGGDSVTGCASSPDGTVRVFNGQNTGYQPPSLFDDAGVTLIESDMENSVLSCSFERLKAASDDGKRFDVTKKWIIMFARGSATINGETVTGVGYHGANKFVTSSKYSSSDTPNVGTKPAEYPLVKAHGGLMVFSWVFFASIGTVAARYYKPVWKGTLYSQKVWFQIHRTCMVLVFGTTVAGFVVIFLEVEDWSHLIEDDEHLEYHPAMGVVVTALTVLNPLMALIRPHPGTKHRPLFNWTHWLVGNVSHILAVITIFFGIELQKSQSQDYLVYILAGYVAWQVLVELVLEVMQYSWFDKVCRTSKVMDGSQNQNSEKEDAQAVTVKKSILFVHVFVLTIFTGIIVAFIVIGDEDLE